MSMSGVYDLLLSKQEASTPDAKGKTSSGELPLAPPSACKTREGPSSTPRFKLKLRRVDSSISSEDGDDKAGPASAVTVPDAAGTGETLSDTEQDWAALELPLHAIDADVEAAYAVTASSAVTVTDAAGEGETLSDTEQDEAALFWLQFEAQAAAESEKQAAAESEKQAAAESEKCVKKETTRVLKTMTSRVKQEKRRAQKEVCEHLKAAEAEGCVKQEKRRAQKEVAKYPEEVCEHLDSASREVVAIDLQDGSKVVVRELPGYQGLTKTTVAVRELQTAQDLVGISYPLLHRSKPLRTFVLDYLLDMLRKDITKASENFGYIFQGITHDSDCSVDLSNALMLARSLMAGTTRGSTLSLYEQKQRAHVAVEKVKYKIGSQVGYCIRFGCKIGGGKTQLGSSLLKPIAGDNESAISTWKYKAKDVIQSSLAWFCVPALLNEHPVDMAKEHDFILDMVKDVKLALREFFI